MNTMKEVLKLVDEGRWEGGKILRLESLRRMVEERFPEAVRVGAEAGGAREEGIPRGVLTEVHGSVGSVSLFLLRELARDERLFAGLVDASDALEVGEFPAGVLRRMLWVRCRGAVQAVQAADLLLRDGNLSLVVLDLRGVPAGGLAKVPASAWHRFQKLLEGRPVSMAVCTDRPCIAPARGRIEVHANWILRDLVCPRSELMEKLHVHRRRRGMPVEERRTA